MTRVRESTGHQSGGMNISEDMVRIEEKWQKRWSEARLFESTPDGRDKFYATYPYSYMNGLPHIGHAFTVLRVEFQCRYRRMRGYNVLFPFAFHCTGVPIVAAAKRIKDGESTQMQIMRSMGITDRQVKKFSEPEYWTRYFPKRWENSMRRLGMSIDWRRKFITTPLNPSYDSFVRWQFNVLREKNYVRLGSHAVIWCPKDNIPVGDHDRVKGEGETPTEYTLLKFRTDEGDFLVTATLRPETAFGQTNLWINPEADYVRALVDNEVWILSKEAADKLTEQGRKLTVKGSLKGEELTGAYAFSPTMGKRLVVLPAPFASPSKGTGIVTSVPSDSPDDYIALKDLKRKAENDTLEPSIAHAVVNIEPVEIIDTPGYGTLPAKTVVDRLNIRSQKDKEKLDRAREEVYREGYYKGVMLERCAEYAGLTVDAARSAIRKKLLESGDADTMYEPSGEVVCRCLTRCIVKVVSNQWFLAYGDQKWKEDTHEAIASMRFYPPLVRKQFEHVVDWLKDWACVHHTGLGTTLPWDDAWKIESLSDSTIYMAYYTIAHVIQKGKITSDRKLGQAFFDYVFLGIGDSDEAAVQSGFSRSKTEEMRKEFLYWYPMDMRNSGKDLVGNHLTFAAFNHVAIFPREHWPRSYGVNGWITISGTKMGKSAGNSLYLDDAIARFGADVTRLTEAYADEGFDDPNFDTGFAETAGKRLLQMLDTAKNLNSLDDSGENSMDVWMMSMMARHYGGYIAAMEDMSYKNAVKSALVDMQNSARWYIKRRGTPNRRTMRKFAELQVMMLAPFTPHVCEEAWEAMGNQTFVSTQLMPEPSTMIENAGALAGEGYLEGVIADISEILKVTEIVPEKITIYTAAKWKTHLLIAEQTGNRNDSSAIRKQLSSGVATREMEKFYRNLSRERQSGRLKSIAETAGVIDEHRLLNENTDFLAKEFRCRIEVPDGDAAGVEDRAGRRENSFPLRPSIFVE